MRTLTSFRGIYALLCMYDIVDLSNTKLCTAGLHASLASLIYCVKNKQAIYWHLNYIYSHFKQCDKLLLQVVEYQILLFH